MTEHAPRAQSSPMASEAVWWEPGWFDKEGACELELDQGVGSGGTAKEVGAWRRKGHGRLVGNREVGVWRSKGGECGRAVGSGGTAKEVVVRRR